METRHLILASSTVTMMAFTALAFTSGHDPARWTTAASSHLSWIHDDLDVVMKRFDRLRFPELEPERLSISLEPLIQKLHRRLDVLESHASDSYAQLIDPPRIDTGVNRSSPEDIFFTLRHYRAIVKDAEVDSRTRAEALRAFVTLGESSAINEDLTNEMIAVARRGDAVVRRDVLWALRGKPFKAVRDLALEWLLFDASRKVREEAAELLENFIDSQDVRIALTRAVEVDTSPRVRRTAASALTTK